MVEVDGVNVPVTANGVPLPVNINVFEPFMLSVCEAATVTRSAVTEDPRFICGEVNPVEIETMPMSCLVVLLSVHVFVPVGFNVNVPLPLVKVIWLEQVAAQTVRLPATFMDGLWVEDVMTVPDGFELPPRSRLFVTVKVWPEAVPRVWVTEAAPGKICKL